MSALFAALSRFSVRFRYPVALAWILITVFSVRAFPSLASVAKDTNSGFLPASSPSIQAQNLLAPFINYNLAQIVVAASRAHAPLTAADQATIAQAEARLRALPRTKAVIDRALSRDGQARQILVEAAVPPYGSGSGPALVATIRHTLAALHAPAGLVFNATGQLPTIVDTQSDSKKSQGNTQAYSIVFIILLLLFAFRAALAPLITLLPAALVLALSSPVIAGATHFGVQASSITQVILIVLILGAGTDYGLFLVFRVREELRRGLAPKEAVVRALTAVGETITFSALTVIAALLSLLSAQFGFYQGLGPALAIGIGLMLLAGLTFLPALLAIFGRAAFWPSNVARVEEQHTGIWGSLSVRVVRHPWITTLAGTALFVALALGLTHVGLTGFGDQTGGPAGSDSAVGQAVIAAHFPGASTNPTLVLFRFPASVWSDPRRIAAAQQSLKGSGWFGTLTGPLNPIGYPLQASTLAQLHARLGPPQALAPTKPTGLHLSAGLYNLYRASGQYISLDGRTVQFSTVLRANNTLSAHDTDQTPQVRAAISAAARAAGATTSGEYGQMSFVYDINQIAASDLRRIIPLVAGIILLLLAIVLRSLTAPFYLVISVVLSYLAALGLAGIVFVHLGSSSGLNFVLPFLMFVFLMALGSDYNILVMTRIREEAHTLPLRQAVRRAVGITGSTITTAGTILAGTFGVLGAFAGNASGADQIRQIGFGIACGVLMDTFIIRTLLVPSLAVLLGRWNWWPSALFRQGSREQDEAELVA